MRLFIGAIFKWGRKSHPALEIPNVGIIEAITDDSAIFPYIDLTVEQLIKLRDEINKELELSIKISQSTESQGETI